MPNKIKKTLYFIILILIFSLAKKYDIKFYIETLFSIRTAHDSNGNITDLINKNHFIAHAGGGIDKNKYTNSKEAVLNSISSKFKLIELDLRVTSDGQIVALHDWKSFKRMSGLPESTKTPLSFDEFSQAKIHSRYEPLAIESINEIFQEHKDIYLVTDKIKDFQKLGSSIKFKERVIIEVFNISDYNKAIKEGFKNIALNIRKLDDYTSKWLQINQIPAVTFGYYNDNNISIEDIRKLCSNGIALMIYSDNDKNISNIHKKTNCKNIAIYVDFLDIENWNYKK